MVLSILFYFHLSAQFKKPREPYEIFETTFESRQQLDNNCAGYQPFLFDISPFCPLTITTTLGELIEDAESDAVTTFVDNDRYYASGGQEGSVIVPLKMIQSYSGRGGCYFGGTNCKTGVWKTIADEFTDVLAPKGPIFSEKIGHICGSSGTTSIPQYHTQTAKYLVVLVGGDIDVKITSIRNYEKLNGKKCQQMIGGNTPVSNFTHFCGQTNIWNIEQNIKLQKIPFLEFNIGIGYALSIPPFTIWSIKINHPGTVVLTADYITFINSVANIGNWVRLCTMRFQTNHEDEDDEDTISIVNNDVCAPPSMPPLTKEPLKGCDGDFIESDDESLSIIGSVQ